MGRKSTYGTVEKHGKAAVAGSKMGVRNGPGQKNVNSRRRNKPSNAGVATGPLKGPDKGRG